MTGCGLTCCPVSRATMAPAAILPWLFAMLADFGMAAAASVASPRMWIPGAALDSIESQSTSHHRLLVVISFALAAMFPNLPVTLFTEALGGAEQRLFDGSARLGIFTPRTQSVAGLTLEAFPPITLVPVVASSHALARAAAPIPRDVLEDHVQLVLTDRTQVTAGFSGGVISHRVWRFADLAARLDYLLAGFGWCNMPLHMVEGHIEQGHLTRLHLKDYDTLSLPVAGAYATKHPPGRAGRWLIDDLTPKLAACPAKYIGKDAAPRRKKLKR